MELLKKIEPLLTHKILTYTPKELIDMKLKLSKLGIGSGELSEYTFCSFRVAHNTHISIVYLKKEIDKLPFKDRPIKSFSALNTLYYNNTLWNC